MAQNTIYPEEKYRRSVLYVCKIKVSSHKVTKSPHRFKNRTFFLGKWLKTFSMPDLSSLKLEPSCHQLRPITICHIITSTEEKQPGMNLTCMIWTEWKNLRTHTHTQKRHKHVNSTQQASGSPLCEMTALRPCILHPMQQNQLLLT